METGLLQPKGQVHFEVGTCINPSIESISDSDKSTLAREVCNAIDGQIHTGYKLFPINYIAYDQLSGTTIFADKYTDDEVAGFNTYIRNQIGKVEEQGITDDDRNYMHEMMLTMYSNPVKNKINSDITCQSTAENEQN